MPYVSGSPNANDATFPKPSLIGSIGQQLQSVAAGYGNSIANPAQQWGLIKSKPVSVGSVGTPWNPSMPASDASRLQVYGVEVPDGIVLTHCTVTEQVQYRAYPLSDVSPIALLTKTTEQIKMQKGPGGKFALASNLQTKLIKDKFAAAPSATGALQADSELLSELKGSNMTLDQLNAKLATAAQPSLAQAGVELGKARLEKKVGKVYISSIEPRRAELRLVLHDVITPVAGGGPANLVHTRYDLLEMLWRLFCRNPQGVMPYKDLNTVMSDAARITAENSAGHLVSLASQGLKPYGVQTWLTTSFSHIEVPDIDVIAVKITLLEFESNFTTGQPTSPAAPTADSSVAPAAIKRPSYVSQMGIG